MKKFFTFLVALVATLTVSAQQKGAMNFIGGSEYIASIMGMTISGTGVKDTLVVADENTSISFPAMTVMMMGQQMVVPSIKIANLAYTMEGNPMAGNAVFTWDKGETDTTVMVKIDGVEQAKVLKISSLHAVYTHSSGKLDVTLVVRYGTMPGDITFKQTGYYTVDNAWKLVGRGTENNPYRLFDAADFDALAANISSENTGKGEWFQVMNDIDFKGTAESAVQLPAIGRQGIQKITSVDWGFQGVFDGNGKAISGIYHTNNANDVKGAFQALFSSLGEGGVVKNLTFTENNSISAYNYAAPFVSINKGGSIEGCVNNAQVTGSNTFAAGICGYLVAGKGSVKNCTNNGTIKSMSYTSGIVAGTQSGSAVGTKDADYVNYIVEGCVNNGNCSSTNGTGSAGIAGSFSGVITNCTNNGVIDDAAAGKANGQNTGGIVAAMTYIGGLTGNVNKGTVKGVKSVAGIVGKVMKGSDEAFDISNNTNEGVVEASSLKGDIMGSSARTQQDVKPSETAISEVAVQKTPATYKTLVGGRVVIVNGNNQYNTVGSKIK